jgi:hypothetical protein
MNRPVLSVACPQCGSQVGSPCRYPNGMTRPSHQVRVHLWRANHPIDEELVASPPKLPPPIELTDEDMAQMWKDLKYVARVLSPRTPGYPPVPEQDRESAHEIVMEMKAKLHNILARRRTRKLYDNSGGTVNTR